jgi:hypothetical protein
LILFDLIIFFISWYSFTVFKRKVHTDPVQTITIYRIRKFSESVVQLVLINYKFLKFQISHLKSGMPPGSICLKHWFCVLAGNRTREGATFLSKSLKTLQGLDIRMPS